MQAPPLRRPVRRSATLVASVLLAVAATSASSVLTTAPGGQIITGPYAYLLAASKNLGRSDAGDAQVTVTLPSTGRPATLIGWAASHRLAVRWRPGSPWAIVTGPAGNLGSAFGVRVNDYRSLQGRVFYASPQQPSVPSTLRGDVTAVGRILSFLPHHNARPPAPLDVPRPGLKPKDLLRAYNATPLAEAGYTGRGQTVVIFAFDGFDQRDLDLFADTMGLPRFTPEVIGGALGAPHGEAAMDAEVVHAIAPDARVVVVNARPTVDGGGTFEKIGRMFDDTAERYPGSVWTLSIGWGCEALATVADVAPIRSALANAHRHGITAFDASGDNAGLECKGGKDWSSPPGPDHIGVDTIASLPEMTSVGGTTLSTDMQGRWMDEWGWIDPPLSQGTSGGVSRLFARPDYQRGMPDYRGAEYRLVPDVSAVADPFTGMQIMIGQTAGIGGGTSQAAPIWAGMTALMNQFVMDNGGHAIGDINPVLYRVASGARLPGFRDITAGGNAVDNAGEGYDLVTGLGSPNVDNLARNILDAQKATLAATDYLPQGG